MRKFSLFYFLTFFSFGTLSPLLTVYLQENVGLTGSQIGIILSISPVVIIFIQPIWGMISDYTQKPKGILLITLLLTAIFGILYSFVGSFYSIVLMAFLLAVTQSAIVPISDSIALNAVQKTKGDYGSVRLWGAIGFAVAVLIAGWLSDYFSLKVIFYTFSISLFLALLVTARLPKENQSVSVIIRDGMNRLVKIPKFMLFLVTTFLIFGPIFANNFYFGLYITEIGGTVAGVGIAFLFAAGSEAPFMKIAGRWIHRFGLMNIMIFSGSIGALRWFFYFLDPPLMLVYVTTVVQGLSIGLFIPAALQYVRDSTPVEVRATAVSLYSAVGNGLGSWFCTLLGGYIVEYYSVSYLYLFFGVLTVLGIVIVVVLKGMENKGEKLLVGKEA
ncbi:MFS transporter [Sutcliffiella cohnii]